MIALDNDDKNDYGFIDRSFKVFKQDRGEFLNRDYTNPLAAKTKGRRLWFLGDDTEIETEGWDKLIPKDEGVWYGDTYDNTRNFNNVGEFAGFPILSREAYEALGYMFHPDVAGWGSDKYLHHVFSKVGRIINCQNIRIVHHHILDDETSEGMRKGYLSTGSGSNLKYKSSIERLQEAIKCE